MNIFRVALLALLFVTLSNSSDSIAQGSKPPATNGSVRQPAVQQAWMDTSLDPDTRADLMISAKSICHAPHNETVGQLQHTLLMQFGERNHVSLRPGVGF